MATKALIANPARSLWRLRLQEARKTSNRTVTPARAAMPDSDVGKIVQDAIVWANQHGLVVGLGGDNPDVAIVHAPVAAFPVEFPRERFIQAKEAMTAFNALVDSVSRDEAYLEGTLAAAARLDPFTNSLLELLRETRPLRESRRDTDCALGIFRSDYMLDEPSSRFLQVELNTIASSFGCLATKTSDLHRYVVGRLARTDLDPSRLPANPALVNIADALAEGVKAHGAEGGVVLMVVQPGEKNAYDQQWLQLALWERHGVRTLRATLRQIAEEGQVDSNGGLRLWGRRVAVVYYRAGYTPNDYLSEVEWEGRRLAEKSDAVKCPTVAHHLAGTKKVQQDLARPGVLERFVPDTEAAGKLRGTFAGLWSLDPDGGGAAEAAVAAALDNPLAYVLKPQREGGGNNLYGDALRQRLLSGEGLGAFILMQRILPPRQRSVLVRRGEWRVDETVSELGVYGTYLRKGDKVLLNREAGHLVRTKPSTSDEGGVAAGFAVLDSPYLVDTQSFGRPTIFDG